MADKIQASDLLSPDVIKEIKKLNDEILKSVQIMQNLSKTTIDLNKTLKDSSSSNEKLSNDTKKVNNAKQVLTETERQLINNEKLQQKITEQAAGSYAQLSNKLLLLKNQYRQMSEEQRKAGGKQMLSDISKLDKKVKDFDKSLGVHNRNVGNYGKAMEGLKSLLPMIGFAAVANQLMSLGKQMFAVRSEFQKYEAVLKNTLGSEDLARQSMSMLQQTAVLLPVSVKSLTEGFVKLANRGFIPTQKEIIKLNDIASSTGKSLDMFIEAMLDAQTGEFERLKEFGIKAKSEGDKVTFTFKGQSQTVQKTDTAIKDYLLSLGEMQGVIGASAAVMETFEGKVSNIGDSWDNMLNNMGKNSEGVISTIIGWVGQMVESWSWAAKSIKQIQDEVKDEQSLLNFDNAIKEINYLTDLFEKQGFKINEAKEKSFQSYKRQLEESIRVDKEAAQVVIGEEEKALESRILMNTKELEAVTAHFKKIKEIELKKLELTKENKDKIKKLQEREIDLNKIIEADREKSFTDIRKEAEIIATEGISSVDKKAQAQEMLNDTMSDYSKFVAENDAIDEVTSTKEEDRINKQIELEKELAEVRKEKTQLAADMVNGLAELTNTVYDGQLQKLEENKKAELEAAGDNAIKKEKIEKDYAKKQAAIRKKQAIVDKVVSLFNIALNTAMGVTNAMSKVVTMPLVPWIIANGAIQAAIVAAKPIPKFAKGVRNFSGGIAEVGEAGFEAIKTPDGNVFLTPDKATKMALPSGSDVFTHNEAKEMLSGGVSMDKFDELIREQKQTRLALSKQRKDSLKITPQGWKYTQEQNNARITYIDKYFRI